MGEIEPHHEHCSWQPDVKNYLSYARCSSLSRYSLGTSSSGVSCVITSATSGSLAFSTPDMAFASNALPSSPLPRALHSVTRSRRISETARLGPFLVDRI